MSEMFEMLGVLCMVGMFFVFMIVFSFFVLVKIGADDYKAKKKERQDFMMWKGSE